MRNERELACLRSSSHLTLRGNTNQSELVNQPLVRSPQMTLVAVCGGACSAATARALISVSRLLTACGVPVQAARLDALRHDLPWHYTPHSYPTVLVFPPDR